MILMVEARQIAEVMGGAGVLKQRIRSVGELDHAVQQGLPKDALRRAVHHVATGRRATEFLYRIVPQATFKRRRGRLSAQESARTERLARVIAASEQVWGAEDAREWLQKPHAELGRRAPVEVAMTELGARQVEETLERLLFGLPV